PRVVGFGLMDDGCGVGAMRSDRHHCESNGEGSSQHANTLTRRIVGVFAALVMNFQFGHRLLFYFLRTLGLNVRSGAAWQASRVESLPHETNLPGYGFERRVDAVLHPFQTAVQRAEFGSRLFIERGMMESAL